MDPLVLSDAHQHHGTTWDGVRLVQVITQRTARPTGRWFREPADGSRRRPLTLMQAVAEAVLGTAKLGQRGGESFDRMVQSHLSRVREPGNFEERVEQLRRARGRLNSPGLFDHEAALQHDAAVRAHMVSGALPLVPLWSCGCVRGLAHSAVFECLHTAHRSGEYA